jgi:2-polyprenyl-3-methyl-5-hydroxy-6-metoxy-1,4-benzoquinol methylase
MNCRFCSSPVDLTLIDLGSSPPSNAYLDIKAAEKPEYWIPLKVVVCRVCWLAQTQGSFAAEEFFDQNYAYFSSFSTVWMKHAESYSASIIKRFSLDKNSKVVEVASNDGYLLQNFKTAGIPCLGVEPTASTAQAARLKGIETLEVFFGQQTGRKLAETGWAADLVIANNVLAHVPDISDFVLGFTEILKANGVATFEFPHLTNLIKSNQFDTIYHEHYSYLSLTTANKVLAKAGLRIFDVEEIATHGGSLRIYAQRESCGTQAISPNVKRVLDNEVAAGATNPAFYEGLQDRAIRIKNELLLFLLKAKTDGHLVVAYGAAAKGNTLLNFAGIRPDLISFVVDKNPAKQGKLMPGSRIPIVDESRLRQERPDYILILPWNLKEEIIEQLSYTQEWGAKFVTAIPEITVE